MLYLSVMQWQCGVVLNSFTQVKIENIATICGRCWRRIVFDIRLFRWVLILCSHMYQSMLHLFHTLYTKPYTITDIYYDATASFSGLETDVRGYQTLIPSMSLHILYNQFFSPSPLSLLYTISENRWKGYYQLLVSLVLKLFFFQSIECVWRQKSERCCTQRKTGHLIPAPFAVWEAALVGWMWRTWGGSGQSELAPTQSMTIFTSKYCLVLQGALDINCSSWSVWFFVVAWLRKKLILFMCFQTSMV